MAVDLNLEASRGTRAQLLLDSEPYKEAVGRVRQAILEKWAASPVADKDGQHELRLMLKLLGDLEANIREVAQTGKLAQVQIQQEKSKVKRIFDIARGAA